MADNVLEIILKADVDDAQKNIANFNKQLPKIGDAATKANKGLQNVTKNSAQAGNAVLNLGRIAQDSAFGFIGIANNIEPFIQSIKSLKASTEAGSSASKAFFSALAGPAGIGVLIGAVSLLDAFINGYGVFANKAKEAQKAQKDFNDEIDKAKAPALAAGAQLQTFVNIAANSALPLSQRNKALEEGNKILGDYGEKLTLANVASVAITEQTKLFTQALIAQAVATKYADEAANAFIKQEQAIKNISNAQKELKTATDALTKASATSTIQEREAGKNLSLVTNKEKALKALYQANGEYIQITKQRVELDISANEATTKATELFGKLGTGEKDAAAAAKEAAKALKEQNKELKDAAKDAREFQSAFDKIIDPIEKFTASLSKTESLSVSTKLVLATLELNNLLTQNLTLEQRSLAIQQQKLVVLEQAKIAATIAGTPTTAGENLTSNVATITAGTDAAAKDKERARLENLKAISAQVNNITTAFELLSPVIEAAFAALKGGENATENLKQTIKRLIIELIKAAALSAIISLVTGGSANAANGGVSFLQAFKGRLGFRAQGGTVDSGSPYIVGEAGPELFVPTGSGSIVSSGRFGNAGGGGGVLTARVSGGDLLFILNQAGNNRSVNFG